MPRSATAKTHDPTSTERVRRYRERRASGEVRGRLTVSRNVVDFLVKVGLLAAWRTDNADVVMRAAQVLLELTAWDEPRDHEHP